MFKCLNRPSLHSLERRRVGGNLIEVYKWVSGYDKGYISQVLIFSEHTRTRDNGFKLEKCSFKKKIGRNWFTEWWMSGMGLILMW